MQNIAVVYTPWHMYTPVSIKISLINEFSFFSKKFFTYVNRHAAWIWLKFPDQRNNPELTWMGFKLSPACYYWFHQAEDKNELIRESMS